MRKRAAFYMVELIAPERESLTTEETGMGVWIVGRHYRRFVV